MDNAIIICEGLRDTAAIPKMEAAKQEDGTTCYFFGDTCIRAYESVRNGQIVLDPVGGDQVACGEWADLPMDQVQMYCALIAQHLRKKEG